MRIAAILMVKNEAKRIATTLNSASDLDGFVIYDTGSTDDTVTLVEKTCARLKKPLDLYHGEFVDFATSRNMLLELAELLDYDYFLMMDSNDELKNSCGLKEALASGLVDAGMIHQHWTMGPGHDIEYFNIRLIRASCKFRFKGVVHEYIHIPDGHVIEKWPHVTLYQDRVQDNDGKTKGRWTKDVELLLKAYQEDPTDARTQYYLAQTYECLEQVDNALHYYSLRAAHVNGFYEERFISQLKVAHYEKDSVKQIHFYLDACQMVDDRAEPYVELAKIFRLKNAFRLAFIFAQEACRMSYPENAILWVDRKLYDHDRWQELGIVSFYIKEMAIGLDACKKALETGYDKDLNQRNLSFYCTLPPSA